MNRVCFSTNITRIKTNVYMHKIKKDIKKYIAVSIFRWIFGFKVIKSDKKREVDM